MHASRLGNVFDAWPKCACSLHHRSRSSEYSVRILRTWRAHVPSRDESCHASCSNPVMPVRALAWHHHQRRAATRRGHYEDQADPGNKLFEKGAHVNTEPNDPASQASARRSPISNSSVVFILSIHDSAVDTIKFEQVRPAPPIASPPRGNW